MAELAIGDEAPHFSLPAGDDTMRLTDLHGKIVVLYFYPQDDTKSCTAEAVDFSRLKADFEQAGAVIIGVSPDSLKKHERFAAKHGLTISLASDEARETIEAYGVWAEKMLYGHKYMGVVRSTFIIGHDGKIARIWRNVKVKGHADEVLEAVQGL